MSAVQVAHAIIGVRCNYCSKFYPAWRTHKLTDAQTICDYCLEWHNNALAVLAGGVPKGCQACETPWEVLSDSTPGGSVRMYVLPKDGILQLLCAGCVKPYTMTRADLFKGTAFGADLRI